MHYPVSRTRKPFAGSFVGKAWTNAEASSWKASPFAPDALWIVTPVGYRIVCPEHIGDIWKGAKHWEAEKIRIGETNQKYLWQISVGGDPKKKMTYSARRKNRNRIAQVQKRPKLSPGFTDYWFNNGTKES